MGNWPRTKSRAYTGDIAYATTGDIHRAISPDKRWASPDLLQLFYRKDSYWLEDLKTKRCILVRKIISNTVGKCYCETICKLWFLPAVVGAVGGAMGYRSSVYMNGLSWMTVLTKKFQDVSQ